ncbi:hypothetical protein [Priestia koreensis]|uniref:hypothetical protein n=1 Tax=Priestia koreensis TaxID=284581 RepID=UPI0028F6F369|nr:hypothetical protein [Priestia koreensis]
MNNYIQLLEALITSKTRLNLTIDYVEESQKEGVDHWGVETAVSEGKHIKKQLDLDVFNV